MKVEVTESDAWRRTREIEVPREDVNERLKEAYKSYSKSLNLPGFRKGRVPVSVVKARFGPAILERKEWEIGLPSLTNLRSLCALHPEVALGYAGQYRPRSFW